METIAHDGSGGGQSRRWGQAFAVVGGGGKRWEIGKEAVDRVATRSISSGRRSRHLPRSGLVQLYLPFVVGAVSFISITILNWNGGKQWVSVSRQIFAAKYPYTSGLSILMAVVWLAGGGTPRPGNLAPPREGGGGGFFPIPSVWPAPWERRGGPEGVTPSEKT